jgi:uncharacterized membrane protein YhiD involved in acid resistance
LNLQGLYLYSDGKIMAFDWKTVAYTVGGIAAGVGTIACLPVFGAVGVVTGAGFLVGGLVGGGTVFTVSTFSDSEEDAVAATKEALNRENVSLR